ncbi:DUF4178 domain-containing protein [Ruegeria arenilitoris]|uniref:DUF4178 domain-containing protein n=1 Tax=Ruegeria arenilitoris TaxID=1173585 RepID=UPI001481B2B1|nr:DUF4178 domain-containing protein [Ruegeria arenilitoris]
MTRTPELTSINCTSCGAGLDVLGGGRVVVKICEFCGSELNAQDNYKVLRKFTDRKRPWTPFSIGMRGTLYGVEFVIIGLVQHTERWAGRVFTWVDHQLYSPTHGYAWLTLEDRHLVFSRRYRGTGWLSERVVESAEHRPTIHISGEPFRYYETTTSKITYVEGEFTWRPKFGERTTTVSAMSNSAMLAFSQTGSERETYRSIYVTKAEAEAAFGVTLDLKPYRVHPLQPFVAGRNYQFLLVSSFVFAIICLVMALGFNTHNGRAVLRNTQVDMRDLPVEIAIPLEADRRLTSIRVSGDMRNSWAYLEMQMLDPNGQPVFETGRTIESYSGRDADGSWREGSPATGLRFRPEVSGTYTLALSAAEKGLWLGGNGGQHPSGEPFTRLRLDVRAGLFTGKWMAFLGAVFGALFLYQFGRKWLHRRARWSGSDWVDED